MGGMSVITVRLQHGSSQRICFRAGERLHRIVRDKKKGEREGARKREREDRTEFMCGV